MRTRRPVSDRVACRRQTPSRAWFRVSMIRLPARAVAPIADQPGSSAQICRPAPSIEHHLRQLVLDALQDTRVVVVLVARQAGKSTLVEPIATVRQTATTLTLDDQAARRARASRLEDGASDQTDTETACAGQDCPLAPTAATVTTRRRSEFNRRLTRLGWRGERRGA